MNTGCFAVTTQDDRLINAISCDAADRWLNPMTLQGKRILITAPRQYASKLSSLLIAANARPIWLPTIRITSLPKAELPTIDAVLEELNLFSHVAFTSKNGISAVVERLQELTQTQENLVKYVNESNVKLCALGADAMELERHGLKADITPAEASTTGLVQELISRNELNGSKILCPIPSVRGGLTEPAIIPRFLKMLRDGGADVTPLNVYITQMGCEPKDCAAERQLLQEGFIDVIVFTSSAEAQGFIYSIGSLEELQTIIAKNSILLSAHGPYTAAGVSGYLNMEVRCVSKHFKTFDGIIHALQENFQQTEADL